MSVRDLARVWVPGVCKHKRARCIHGDEGWARMKVYTLRWWKEPVVRRQSCLDCGRALDLPAICVVTGDSTTHTCDLPPAETDTER